MTAADRWLDGYTREVDDFIGLTAEGEPEGVLLAEVADEALPEQDEPDLLLAEDEAAALDTAEPEQDAEP